MIMLETFSLILVLLLCILSIKSDMSTGLIRNKILSIFIIIGVFLDIIYYGYFATDLFFEFLINFLIVALLSLFLFYSHSFAGGDSKLVIVLALLYPANYYLGYNQTNITLFFVLGFAIFSGYCYLLINSLWSISTKKIAISVEYIKNQSLAFLKSYLAAIIYISFLNLFFIIGSRLGAEINIWAHRLVCITVAFCAGRFAILRQKKVVISIAIITVFTSIFLKSIPISTNFENYLLVLMILLCQMTIKLNIYERVVIDQIKKGMILSTISSVLMQTSITPGLPGVSTEDLRSRLTTEEIASIKIWAKATHTESLTIVKKIPFAIFISIGFVSYFILWSILRCM